ncbi:luciferin 4-monooxygenase [Drosophila bipectinata]|uniref:luciferin 4-monooxygenase n=1 Tax=Drosophila bipectinata TaxID=42026 RepID=UPI001C896993|nr:luciferin 4-monooxygenase [Drosophila bipectinata]
MAKLPCSYDAANKIWKGIPQNPAFRDDVSIGRIIFRTMRNWSNNLCQISDTDGTEVTFKQAFTWAVRIAQHLKSRGLDNNDVIGISAKNTTYIMPVAVACFFNGTPFQSANPILEESTLKHLYSISKPKVIFTDAVHYDKLYSATSDFKPEIILTTGTKEGVLSVLDLLEPTKTEIFYQPTPLKEGPKQTVAILTSSGTTGLPKAVCISNDILCQETSFVTSTDVSFVSASLDWITGLWATLFSTVNGCCRIITNKPFTPDYFTELVTKYKITYVLIPPEHCCALLEYPGATQETMSSIIKFTFGGGRMTAPTVERLKKLLVNAVLNSSYGMTEVGFMAFNYGHLKLTAAGNPLPGAQIKIVDDDGHKLGPNETGEIVVSNGFNWNGYYADPKSTKEALDEDGWFRTGDVGYFDDDQYLYMTDRKKEVLKWKGLQMWPAEVEAVIDEMPEVKRVCVIGIYEETQGDMPGALVVPEEKSNLTAQQVIDYVASRLPDVQKQLRAGVQFADEIPLNANGKPVRRYARDLFVALSKK